MKSMLPKHILAGTFVASLLPFLVAEAFPSRFYRVMDTSAYLVFHNVSEFFSVVVSLSIFGIWFTYTQSKDRHALFLSAAFLAIGLLDFMHALGYAGMPAFITSNSANKSTQYWIAVRMLTAATFLVSAYIYPDMKCRWISKPALMMTALAVPSLVFSGVTFFPSYMPATFIEGVGLTPFKKVSEYVIIFLLVLAFRAYWRRMLKTGDRMFLYYLEAFILCIFSELVFAVYKSVFDTYNVLGHLYKVTAFYLIYHALFTTAVSNPYGKLADANARLHLEIAGHRNAEELLRVASAYNRTLIEASLDPLVTIGADGKITDVNAATETATGCSRSELIGTDFSDYFSVPEKASEGYREVFHTGQVRDYALEIKRRDGHVTPVLYNATVYRDAAGGVQGIFAAARDVTERRKAEEEACLNLARQKALLDLYQKMAAAPVQEIISFVVDKCVNLTGSAIGLIGLVSADDQFMEAHLWSEKVVADCGIEKPMRFPLNDAGIWAEPIRQRKVMIINDYRTPNPLRKGYLDLTRFMGIPVIDKNRVVAMAGVANKAADYTESDQNKVSLLLEGMWDLIMRKRTEEELRLAGAYNRSLIEASLDPLVTIGPDGKITDVNAATEWATGWTRKELIGTDFCDYFTEPEKARTGYEQVFREGMVRDYALEIRRSDGQETPVLYNAAVYRDENGKVIGVFAAARDTTELKRAEEEVRQLNRGLERRVEERTKDLKQSTVFLENLLEAIPEPVFYKDREGVYLGGNEAFFNYLGKPREAVVGQNVYDINPKHLADIYKKADDNLMKRGGMQVYESRVRYADGTEHDVIFHKATFPNPDGSAGGLIGTILDISERKQNERERERLLSEIELRAAALESANKELEAFAYSVSHDLRAPLRAIDGYSRMMEEDYSRKIDDEGKRILGIVRSETRKMGRLIDDLLEFSRIGRREMGLDEVDMEGLARAVGNETRITSGQGRKIDIRIAALPPAKGDTAMVRQVLVNLLSNAVKFTRPREEAVIEISCENKDDENVYAIRDNGVGFDMKYAQKLFGVFQRLHSVEEFEGTGVGLAIVQRIIQRHGGRVWAEGAVDKGATFYFTLPRRC